MSGSKEARIIETVVSELLPVSGDSSLVAKLVRLISEAIEKCKNDATTRANLEDALEAKAVRVDPTRVALCWDTASTLVSGFRNWEHGTDPMSLWQFPAWELIDLYGIPERINWIERWQQLGGTLTLGTRMIALTDAGIWRSLSMFRLPFPPFDLGSGFAWRQVGRDEAIRLRVINEEEPRLSQTKEDDGLDLSSFTSEELDAMLKELRATSERQTGESSGVGGARQNPELPDIKPPPPRTSNNLVPVDLNFGGALRARISSLMELE